MTSLKRLSVNLICSILLLAAPAQAGAMEEGIKKATEAFIIQYGIDKHVENYIKDKVPKEYLEFAQQWSLIGKIIVEQKVEYKWTF